MYLGKNPYNSQDILWEKDRVLNGHTMIIGTSGTGKSHTIKYTFVKGILETIKDAKIHIIDVHGDLDVDNANTTIFSETKTNGLNIMAISSDPDMGGVRKKVRNIISLISSQQRKLGSRQEAVLQNLLIDFYAMKGFLINDSSTWNKTEQPTLSEFKLYILFKYQKYVQGTNDYITTKLTELNKEVRSLNSAFKNKEKARFNEEEKAKQEEKIAKLKVKLKVLFQEYIENLETGREFEEILKYDNAESLKTVYERIDLLDKSGIFKNNPPDFTQTINRYHIKSLNEDEKRIFVNILLSMLYEKAKEKGEQPYPKTFIIIDEAHMFIEDDGEHIINIISKEARKFGVALVLASQNFAHFNNDLISNSATKIILGIDETNQTGDAKKLQITTKMLTDIIPQKKILVQIKNKMATDKSFMYCLLGEEKSTNSGNSGGGGRTNYNNTSSNQEHKLTNSNLTGNKTFNTNNNSNNNNTQQEIKKKLF
jgi:DNA helicase HerA-like ATPase